MNSLIEYVYELSPICLLAHTTLYCTNIIRLLCCLQIFTIVFTLEAVIKLTGLSKQYFSVGWNNFDLFIVILSIPDLFIYFGQVGNVTGVSELTKIVKVFRLVCIDFLYILQW